jgi:hypothetical protein
VPGDGALLGYVPPKRPSWPISTNRGLRPSPVPAPHLSLPNAIASNSLRSQRSRLRSVALHASRTEKGTATSCASSRFHSSAFCWPVCRTGCLHDRHEPIRQSPCRGLRSGCRGQDTGSWRTSPDMSVSQGLSGWHAEAEGIGPDGTVIRVARYAHRVELDLTRIEPGLTRTSQSDQAAAIRSVTTMGQAFCQFTETGTDRLGERPSSWRTNGLNSCHADRRSATIGQTI